MVIKLKPERLNFLAALSTGTAADLWVFSIHGEVAVTESDGDMALPEGT